MNQPNQPPQGGQPVPQQPQNIQPAPPQVGAPAPQPIQGGQQPLPGQRRQMPGQAAGVRRQPGMGMPTGAPMGPEKSSPWKLYLRIAIGVVIGIVVIMGIMKGIDEGKYKGDTAAEVSHVDSDGNFGIYFANSPKKDIEGGSINYYDIDGSFGYEAGRIAFDEPIEDPKSMTEEEKKDRLDLYISLIYGETTVTQRSPFSIDGAIAATKFRAGPFEAQDKNGKITKDAYSTVVMAFTANAFYLLAVNGEKSDNLDHMGFLKSFTLYKDHSTPTDAPSGLETLP